MAVHQRRAGRRMDAWQVAIADCMIAVIVGHDRKAFDRLGGGGEDHHVP